MSESVTLQAGDSGRTISRSAWNKMCKSAFGSAGKAICDPHEVRVLMAEVEQLLAAKEKGTTSWRRLSRDEAADIRAAARLAQGRSIGRPRAHCPRSRPTGRTQDATDDGPPEAADEVLRDARVRGRDETPPSSHRGTR